MNKNIIANLFNWIREVIESAETPFVLFALVVLPVLAPLVPAVVTGIRLHDQLGFLPWIASVTATVLELLGYVGAIAFIKSIYNWSRREGSFLSVFLNGLAYGFYVYAMYLINVKLGFLSGESTIVNEVFAILSFLTIPTGLLAAEHVSERARKEEAEKRRKEEKEERLQERELARQERIEKHRIKYGGANGGERTPNEHRTNLPNKSTVANKANEIRSFVQSVQANENRTPRVSEIARELGVAKSYASETLKLILNEQEN